MNTYTTADVEFISRWFAPLSLAAVIGLTTPIGSTTVIFFYGFYRAITATYKLGFSHSQKGQS